MEEFYYPTCSDQKLFYLLFQANPKCEKSGCGEWKPPVIDNPVYKGKWSAPLIDNPNYKVKGSTGNFLLDHWYKDKHACKTGE